MKFTDLPLSQKTLKALKESSYSMPTPVQSKTIPIVVEGQDVVVQAKTGSGKTLAFVLPLLELLLKNDWTNLDGLGALVITPTRELALQIFNVLRLVGKYHDFSAGLLIGGKDVKEEQSRLQKMNILICTPGRLLQHMDQTDFDYSQLLLLVLDEADRLLDKGFSATMNAIFDNLPSRQTCLFSATLGTVSSALTKITKNPTVITIDSSTSIAQRYLITSMDKKLDLLFHFIKTHLHCKILVFASTCKQVRFIFEAFCKLQPGIPLLHLTGKQSTFKRLGIYQQFLKRSSASDTTSKGKNKSNTASKDVASRGLDIPKVDWVVQVDCPDDVDTYIHRVGRTGRYNDKGNSILFLLPSELQLIESLQQKGIQIQQAQHKPVQSIERMLGGVCSQYPEIKYLAQKAVVSYVRSVYLRKKGDTKDTNVIEQEQVEKMARAMGLISAPIIKFKSVNKNVIRSLQTDEPLQSDGPSSSEDDNDDKKKVKTRVDKMFQQKNMGVLSDHYRKLVEQEEEDDDVLVLKRVDHQLEGDDGTFMTNPVQETPEEILKRSKTHERKQTKLKKALNEHGLNTKYRFDEDGNPVAAYVLETGEMEMTRVKKEEQVFLERERGKMGEADVDDKQRERERKRMARLERKLKKKKKESGDTGERVALVPVESDGGSYVSDGDAGSYASGSDGEQVYESQDSDEDSEEEAPRKRQRIDDLERIALGLMK